MDNNPDVAEGPLTYGKLAELIADMTDEQRAANVVIVDLALDEYYPAELSFADGNDVLDADHPVIVTLDEFYEGQS